jgi:predicted metalloprotease with PDZ domain
VSVYSPSKKLSAKEVEKEIKEILEAQKNYLGGTLPVERYAFIIYLFKGYFSRSGSYGALEHSYSSFYFLPEAGGSSLAQTIKDVAAHEFFHILTPLNIHSEEIHYFDFNKPVMSKHLWLYEGVTEYFANHMQMYEGLYDATTFFDNMSEKIASSRSNFQDDLSFTQMSKNVLDKYESQYGNVYEKGALIGMCLDVKLRTLSGGKMGLKDLMNELSKKYGKNQPFKDDELFDVITKMTYPEIGEFFRKYVEGSEPLPFAEYFAPLGVVYEEGGEKEVFVIGSVSFALDEARGLLKVSGTWSMTPEDKKTGWRDGDILLEINGKNANISGLKNLVFNDLSKLPAGSKITYKVEREEKGKKKVVTLKGKATKEKTLISHGFSPIDNPTAEQQKLFRAWAFTK